MIFALVVTFTGCGKITYDTTPPVLPLPRPGVQFIATPARGDSCGASQMRVHFDWTITAPQEGDDFDLRVDSPISAPFASGNRGGHADTGNWAHVGQWFYLVDRQSREVVAAIRIGPDECLQ